MTLTAEDIRSKHRLSTFLAAISNRSQNPGPYSNWTTGYHGAATPPSGSGEAVTETGKNVLHVPESASPVALVGLSRQQLYGIEMLLWDRIVHTSGLSHTAAGAQTVNTTPLPRYTDGRGVMGFIEIYTFGTGSAYGTVSYTNQDGTAGRTGTVVTMSGNLGAGFVHPIALQSGDTGIRSIETVTMATPAPTVVGNFGVTLARLLAVSPMFAADGGVNDWEGGSDALSLGVAMIEPGAFLWPTTSNQGGSGGPDTLMRADWVVE